MVEGLLNRGGTTASERLLTYREMDKVKNYITIMGTKVLIIIQGSYKYRKGKIKMLDGVRLQ